MPIDLEEMRQLAEAAPKNVDKPRFRKMGKWWHMEFPMDGDVEDIDVFEDIGKKVNQLLRDSGLKFEMAVDDWGEEDDESLPVLRVSVKVA